MPEIITDDEFAALREAQELLRQRVPLPPLSAPVVPGAVAFAAAMRDPRTALASDRRTDAAAAIRAAAAAHGAPPPPDGPSAPLERCDGGCGTAVPRRGAWCDVCGEAARRRARELDVADARESISPGGAAAWCRAGDPQYAAAIAKGVSAAPPERAELLTRAAWKRDTGSMLLLGPTDYGKTRVLCAIGNRVLDYAVKLASSKPPVEDRAEHEKKALEVMRFARGVRYMSALDLGRARSESRWQKPEIVRAASTATLLLLDEFGWEEQRFDPHAVRDVLRARFDPVWKPTIVASGETYAKLAARYGEPTLRLVTCKGVLIDLHPKGAGK